MKYHLQVSEYVDDIFQKLSKRNRKQLEIINKKINKILEDPHHFKPLRGDMKGSRRVHIDKSFVLIYEIDENSKTVNLIDYDHHDKVY
ncbi:type II toxin-antitoxin system mRNA interferase toxin, RelE/StbE family [archaeon]|nr:type II toxin-antitoxin system mRNA interferase toxin, RelE/StbE family [archaeon]